MKDVTVIPGEGAAAEALKYSIEVIQSFNTALRFHVVEDPLPNQNTEKWLLHAKQMIDQSHTTVFGACSKRYIDVLIYLRWKKELYANIRPIKWYPGFNSPLKNPHGIDFIIVRENLEDLYVGVEGDLRELNQLKFKSQITGELFESNCDGVFSLKAITKQKTENIVRMACKIARKRKNEGYPGHLTIVSKYNLLSSDQYFNDICEKVCKNEFSDIKTETCIVDNFAQKVVSNPSNLDVVLLPNLYGDIISDEAAGIVGGLGLCPSGCYGENYAYFEATHGAALDLQGKGVINPTATLLSLVLMFEYLEMQEEADDLKTAIVDVYQSAQCLTPDQGGNASTKEFCSQVMQFIQMATL